MDIYRKYRCGQWPQANKCDRNGPGGFMGHTCGPALINVILTEDEAVTLRDSLHARYPPPRGGIVAAMIDQLLECIPVRKGEDS